MIGALNEGCQNIFRIFRKLSVLMSKMISQSFVLAQDLVRSGGRKKNCAWAWMSTGLSHTCFICFQRRTFSLCNGAQSPSCLRCCGLGVTPPRLPVPPAVQIGSLTGRKCFPPQPGMTTASNRPPPPTSPELHGEAACWLSHDETKDVTNSAFITHAGISSCSWRGDPETRPSRGRVRI